MAANDQNALPGGSLPPAVKTARSPSELYLDELTQVRISSCRMQRRNDYCIKFPDLP
ncbi:hypothetical protein Tco_1023827, partial [Tanacetum coccineum]